jgi:hypothetical protein
MPFIIPQGGNGVFSAAGMGNFSEGGCIAGAFFFERLGRILVNDFKCFYHAYSVRDDTKHYLKDQ